jgi:hypothetical protein
VVKIKLRINEKGDVLLEVDGIEGQSCHDISRHFEEALGTCVDVEEKPEYYAEIDQQIQRLYRGDE